MQNPKQVPYRVAEAFMSFQQTNTQADVSTLEKRIAELSDADGRKNEFLAMLAHELRNPLAPLRSGLDLLRLERPDCDTIAIMQGQLQQLVNLVDDLLDVSRIMRGQIRLNRETTQIAGLIERSVETAQSVIDSYEHRLEVAVPDGDIWVFADGLRISQVITNLLNNAAKYTTPGGLIQLTVQKSDQDVVISVRDNGVGIESDYRSQVFELFAQADSTLDRAAGGLGLGLHLVQQLVSLHGGTVSVESEGLDRGSEFLVRLPTASAPLTSDNQANAIPMPVEPASACRVLVVDDTMGSARIMDRILRAIWHHDVEMAHDGPTACAVAEEFLPDVIFLDIELLPGMDGYQVAEELRNRPTFATTVIVAVTGHGTEADRQRSQDAGIDLHLVKPISVDQLGKVFETLTNRRLFKPEALP